MQTNNCTNNELKNQIALFRFSVISPLVNNCNDSKSKMEFFRKASLKQYTLPNGKISTFSPLTIKTWYLNYLKGGFDEAAEKVQKK